ncbi:unnamed protein product [Mytilus coruscus]|uniref:Short-chain collagen C4 n=1 Tax=Mytilus coruscus TaxID=42192 RepID=A0A6J8BBG1_MYTCO|nr:unnamed protein product [Mytilus coruscus]
MAQLDLLQQQFQILNTDVSHLNALKMNDKLPMMESQLRNLVNNFQHAQIMGSTVYTVWGRKSCPVVNGTEIVYTGITGGKSYSVIGSGVDMLCLPHDPESAPADFPTSVFDHRAGKIWGSEYQFTYKNIAVDDTVPCAVCKVRAATSTLMIPAKRSCPLNWTLQYKGVIATGNDKEYASDFVCIDENPEYFEGTRMNNFDGRTLYPISAQCGSLPCPPYKQDQYIACVVCSL